MDRIQFIHPPRAEHGPSRRPCAHCRVVRFPCADAWLAARAGILLSIPCATPGERFGCRRPDDHSRSHGHRSNTIAGRRRPLPLAALTPPAIPLTHPPSVVTQPQFPVAPVKLPDDGVPVLALQPSKPMPAYEQIAAGQNSNRRSSPDDFAACRHDGANEALRQPGGHSAPPFRDYAPGEMALPPSALSRCEARDRGQTWGRWS